MKRHCGQVQLNQTNRLLKFLNRTDTNKISIALNECFLQYRFWLILARMAMFSRQSFKTALQICCAFLFTPRGNREKCPQRFTNKLPPIKMAILMQPWRLSKSSNRSSSGTPFSCIEKMASKICNAICFQC